MKHIYIAPGHTAISPGAYSGAVGMHEWSYAMHVIADLATKKSRKYRLMVGQRREGDTEEALEGLALDADDRGANLYLEVHFNSVSASHPDAHRALMVISSYAGRRTEAIASALGACLGPHCIRRMIKSHGGVPLAQLHTTRCPAVLVEVANAPLVPRWSIAADMLHAGILRAIDSM